MEKEARGPGRSRQSELFLGGLAGRRPGVATRFDRLQAQAREALPVAGESGVRDDIANLRAEFDLTLGLAGIATAADLDDPCLVEVS